MKQGIILLAAGLAFTACSKDDKGPAPKPSVGIAFSTTEKAVDMNTTETSFSIVMPVTGEGVTKADLESRFKLKLIDSASNAVDTSLAITKTTIGENPLTVTVDVTAKPTFAVVKRAVFVTFDESMQPITVGAQSKFTVQIAPFAPAATWFKTDAYYQPNVYYYTASTSKWATLASHFPVLDTADATVIGFVNNYVAESGTTLFNMHRMYSATIGSTNAKTAKINVPRVLKLVPATPGARTGVVTVINQKVKVTKTDNTTFNIGISGTGTYDLDTKVMEIEVNFDDTEIGGAAVNKYQYKISVDKLTL